MVTPATVLIVDDEEDVRRSLARILTREGHLCATAADVAEARGRLAGGDVGLVLCDVTMPGESGMELLLELSPRAPDIAVVMVTGVDDARLARRALELGAFGYVVKPFEANEIIINVANALLRRSLETENRTHRQHLERLVAQRTASLAASLDKLAATERELRVSQEETIDRLACAAEFRDSHTGVHIKRMTKYCALIARHAGLSAEDTETLRLASTLHDVGKIGVPDAILTKPGPLTAEERVVVQGHAEMGARILAGSHSELLRLAADIALSHHERWDGAGYPRGLAGRAIPEGGRITAIADVFDALTSERPYKHAIPIDEALGMLEAERSRHFDPELLDVFFAAADEAAVVVAASVPRIAVLTG